MTGQAPAEAGSMKSERPAAMSAVNAVMRRRSIAEMAGEATFWGLVAGLAWTPYWYGSNVLLAWGINAIIFPALVIVLELTLLAVGASHAVSWRVVAMPFLLAGFVFVFIVVQTATWTPHSLHHPVWDMTAAALNRPLPGSITVNRDLTLQALLRFLTAVSVFWLALQLCRDARRAGRLMLAVAAIVNAYAIYGLAARGVGSADGQFVSSTFVNRNHFAAYAGIGLLISLGLLLDLYHSLSPAQDSWRRRMAEFLETTGSSGALLTSVATIIVAALVLTGSRGGIVSFAAGGLVLVFLIFGRRKGAGGEHIAVIGLFGLLVAAAFTLFGDAFFGKVEQLGFADDSRQAIYRLTVSSILNAPVLGYGYGTFADVFPMFRDRSVDVAGVWTEAHNSYLEVLQGLGLFFGSALIASVALLAARCVTGAVTRRASSTVPAIAAATSCLIGLNSVVDFSLQIQSITLTFMAILGAGVSQSISSRIDLKD